MTISGLTYAALAPALLRFALRVAARTQGWLPAGWLAFTMRGSNPLDRYERFPITWSSPFPVILTLPSSFSGLCLTLAQFDCQKAAYCLIMGCDGRGVNHLGFHQCLLCAVGWVGTEMVTPPSVAPA